MDSIYVMLITSFIGVFLGGFISARKNRVMQWMPVVFMIYVQRKWLTSVLMGLLFSGILALELFETGFSIQNVLASFILFLTVSVSSYAGLSLGWGRSLASSGDVVSAHQGQVHALPDHVVVDDTLNSVKITTNIEKRWLWFSVPSKETIEIDCASVRIEEYFLGFKSEKQYSAENIKRIATLLSLGGTKIAVERIPSAHSKLPAFIIWHRRGLKPFHFFGKGVDLADAQSILDTIYSRFPQYRG